MSSDTEDYSEKTQTPASGERRAIGGYYPQFRIAAFLTLRALREETLEWIRVADPKAGKVDDFQISTRGRVDAFQMKWSRYGGTITFRELTGEDGLIGQLGDGWKRLQDQYPKLRVVVHLITNQTPSINDRVTATDRHTAAFIEETWRQAKRVSDLTSWNPPEAWYSAWEYFVTSSTLKPVEFAEFIRDCELEFNYRDPASEDSLTEEAKIFGEDLRQMTENLLAAVADPAQIVEITRDELLGRLGWRDRVEFRSRHEFPVEESLYEPIASTLEAVGRALETFESGYLGILGSPGSGKSTLLTHCLRTRPERIIRYYAYVPDAQDPLQIRGEATNFLHDLTHALDQSGFRVGASLSRFDRSQLLQRFHEQLRLLHEDWQATGRKTIILIDGLDHIERELKPGRSLLVDLPIPEQVPNGVLIVLGSQTDQLTQLPSQVQYMIRQPTRRIELLPLSRSGVYRLLERGLPSTILTDEQKERIYRLSDGHPLALRLLINQLRGAEGENGVVVVLDQADAYTGDIESQYHSYWRQFEQDDELTHLLGLAARLRRVVDLRWIESWAGNTVVSRFRRKLAHYFRIEASDNWYFFHNSFRVFVIKQTLQIAPGKIEFSREQEFQRELAERCAASIGYVAWEELYHRIAAEQHDIVLQRATPEWFRKQLFALRPIDAIETDIRLALRSVAALHDPIALVRLNLIAAEMGQRKQYLDNFPLAELLLGMGEYDIAIEHVRDGNRLRIKQQAALSLSSKFKEYGLNDEARKLFELSEPVDLLASPSVIEEDPQRNKRSTVDAWASTAYLFRDIDEIVQCIRRLRYHSRYTGHEGREEDGLQKSLLFKVGIELLAAPSWPQFSRILSEFRPDDNRDQNFWFWLNVHGWRRASELADWTRAQSFLESVRAQVQNGNLEDEERVVLAEVVYRIHRDADEGRKLFADIQQPMLVDDFADTRAGMAPFLHRFRINRLLVAFGIDQPLVELVPNADDPRRQGIVYFERAICVIAKIWGRAWRGSVLQPDALMREITSLLRLFYRRSAETRHWSSWYFLTGLRSEFFKLLIRAVRQHSRPAVEALAAAFTEEWKGEFQGHWPMEVRRSIILALFHAGIKKEWVIDSLGELESYILEHDVIHRVSECRAQAEAWLRVEERERAHAWMLRGVEQSLGVGYRKDYQLNDWIYWLTLVNKVSPEDARDRIIWFAQASLTLEESTEGRASTLAANKLLRTCFRWSPRRAISLFRFFIDHHIINFEDAICELLSDQIAIAGISPDMVRFIFADFVVPIAKSGDENLAMAIFNQAAEGTNAVATVNYSVTHVSIFGLPSTRRKWRRGFARATRKKGIELATIGLDTADLSQDPNVSTGGGLQLKDGSTMDAEAVELQVDSLSALESLIEKENENSYFDWAPILIQIRKTLDAAAIERLANKFENRHRTPFALAVLAECSAQLGDLSYAWDLGLRALDLSREYGWSKWADGGSRVAAFQALVLGNKTQGRDLAYKTLARDGGGGAENLKEILPLLVDELPVKEIWNEVEIYVKALFSGQDLGHDAPNNFGAELPANDCPTQAFADLLASHIDHAAPFVSQCAQRACLKLLLNGSVEMQRAVQELLLKENGNPEPALFLFESLARTNAMSLLPFRAEIVELSRARNYAVRRSAMRISKRLDWEVLSANSSPAQLPPIYDLVLVSPQSDFLSQPQLSAELVLPDTRNARELILPFSFQFDELSDISNVPQTNLCYRAVQIMEELAARETWSAEGELRLRAVLSSAGLEFSFRRPRALLARRALFHIIGELIDAKRITLEKVAACDPLFTFDDPVLFLIEPGPRPPEIVAMPREGNKQHEEWIERIEEVCEVMMGSLHNGWRVIAEQTTLKKLEWGVPTETRCSVVYTGDKAPGGEKILTGVPASQIDGYWAIDSSAEVKSLAIQNNAFMYDTIGANWIGFTPMIARELGWQRSSEGMMAWQDESGQVVAKTIWWTDGSLQHYPPPFEEEIGEGWLVVVSPEAWETLTKKIGSLSRAVRIDRAFKIESGEERRKTFTYGKLAK